MCYMCFFNALLLYRKVKAEFVHDTPRWLLLMRFMKKVNHGREMVFKIAFRLCTCACVFRHGTINRSYEFFLHTLSRFLLSHTHTKVRMFICLPLFWAQAVLSFRIEIKLPFDPTDRMHFMNFCILHNIIDPFSFFIIFSPKIL